MRATLVRDGLLVVALVFDAWLVLNVFPDMPPMVDGVSWWIVDLHDPYRLARESMLGSGAFRFSPTAALAMAPLAVVPWPAYVALNVGVQLVAIVAMAGRRWPYVVLFPPVFLNLWGGNVDTLMGAAIAAGFRWPAAWAFLLLTKVTPGIGVLWFAARREWRAFAVALGATGLAVALSLVLAPHLWPLWFEALVAMSRLPQSAWAPPLLLRIPLAAALVVAAARSDRRWLLPVACWVAVPNPWFITAAIMGASIALAPPRRPMLSIHHGKTMLGEP